MKSTERILSYFYRQPDHKTEWAITIPFLAGMNNDVSESTSQLEQYENSPVEKSINPCHSIAMARDFSIRDIAQGKEHHQKVIKQENVHSLFPDVMADHLFT